MDEQGIEKALMFPAAAHDIEYEFADNVAALYANIRAFNRWMLEEVGYVVENRMFLPPYIALADPDLAIKELETVMADGATIIQTKSGHAHGGRDNPFGGRSPADPVYDRFWSIVNEAGIRLAVHLGGTDYQKYGADWSENPEAVFGDFDAFQWMMYWGDRPAMELTAGLILHNFFGRFPNIKVCLSEMGTVWLPYTLRKMDHAFLMGRKAKWSDDRPARPPALGDLPRALHRRPLSRGERSPRRGRGRASNPSSSARTSPTAKAWPTRPVRRRPAFRLRARTSNAGSCATTSRTSSRPFLTQLRFQNRGSTNVQAVASV